MFLEFIINGIKAFHYGMATIRSVVDKPAEIKLRIISGVMDQSDTVVNYDINVYRLFSPLT